MTFHFEAEALLEYEDAAQYSEDRFGLGRQFVLAVQSALDAIANAPTRFQSVGQDIRIFRMRRFPYYIFYHYDAKADTVTIYALAHHKRRPDYWRERLSP